MNTECFCIVLVDDHIQIRQTVKAFLDGEAGLQVIGEAGNGVEVLSLLYNLSAEQKLKPHLIILDVSMPRLGGIEAARYIKRAYPSVKILLLSNHDYREYLNDAISGCADGYLLKSDAGDELLTAIRAIIVKDGYLSTAVAKPESYKNA